MTVLTHASHEWRTRPADERFTSLIDLRDFVQDRHERTRSAVVDTRRLTVRPVAGDVIDGVEILGPNGNPALPSHWAFNQSSQQANFRAGELRKLPAPIVSDILNWQFKHSQEDGADVRVHLVRRPDGVVDMQAMTSPTYGLIPDFQLADALVSMFGDGINGQWRVPGEFGKEIVVDKNNTTLYAGDRNMFVFLADEKNKVEIPNRRNGEPGMLSRGFFAWNSEVGSETIGAAFFLFDHACRNRMVWGVENLTEIRIRHTSGAPKRWLEEIQPVLIEYSEGSAQAVVKAIEDARNKRVDDAKAFLSARFSKQMTADMLRVHLEDEGHPVENLWDAANAVTGFARSIPYQDDRLVLERKAGEIMKLAA